MSRTVEIDVAAENRTLTATFEPIRAVRNAGEVGWIQLGEDDFGYRFPAVVTPAQNRRGYTVHSARDWQSSATLHGDLSDPYDWARFSIFEGNSLTGTGPKASTGGLSLNPYRLPLTVEQWDCLAADFGPARIGGIVGDRPGSRRAL